MRFHHAGIEVSDLERSIHFYEKVLGFEVAERLTLRGESLALLRKDSLVLELVANEVGASGEPILPARSAQHRSHAHLAFEVEDVWVWVERVPVIEGPIRYENGWVSLFAAGPDGEWLEFIQLV